MMPFISVQTQTRRPRRPDMKTWTSVKVTLRGKWRLFFPFCLHAEPPPCVRVPVFLRVFAYALEDGAASLNATRGFLCWQSEESRVNLDSREITEFNVEISEGSHCSNTPTTTVKMVQPAGARDIILNLANFVCFAVNMVIYHNDNKTREQY